MDNQTPAATPAAVAPTSGVINTLFNDVTTVGKTGKVVVWSGFAVIILQILTAISNNPSLFSWHSGVIVVVANALLVFGKNIFSSTPNI